LRIIYSTGVFCAFEERAYVSKPLGHNMRVLIQNDVVREAIVREDVLDVHLGHFLHSLGLFAWDE
jgi:hypothetical protein